MFDDDVQTALHQLLELVHPESISIFRLDQEVRTISSAHSHSEQSSNLKADLIFVRQWRRRDRSPMVSG